MSSKSYLSPAAPALLLLSLAAACGEDTMDPDATAPRVVSSSPANGAIGFPQDLTVSSAASILLIGGALPRNVFWQVAGSVQLDTTAHLEGVVLTQTAITLRTGASIRGRLLAQTAVSLDSSTIVQPAP